MDRRDMLMGGLVTTLGLAGGPGPVVATTNEESSPAAVEYRTETDSLGEVEVPTDKLWGGQTQRSLEHLSIGTGSHPAGDDHFYAILKKAAASANYSEKRLGGSQHQLIVQVCDEILAGQHHDMFPLTCG
jgi:fumarate hydratase, class II